MAGSVEVGRGHVTLSAEDSQLKRGLQSAKASISSWVSNIATGIAQGLGQALFASITNGIRSAMGAIRDSVKDASDLTESINKVGVAFGSSSKDILDWSKNSAAALGQSRQQALEAASGFGLMFGAMGIGREESAKMSKSLVELASDLASIQNSSPEEALIKLRAGLVGEAEPLRVWGVLLDEATVAQKGVQLGLAKTADALTAQDKVMARYQIILDQTAASQGDFANTSDQLANSQRKLDAQIQDASASLGSFFLPVQLAFTKGMSELLTAVGPFGLKIMRAFANGLADGIIAITPVLVQVKSLFTYLLEAHSPPRLLPDLMKWGQAAMQAYLEGWSLADFSALRDLGGAIEDILRSFVGTGDIAETDIVGRVFGSQKAIANAIQEFRNMGSVSQETLNGIAKAAGPAGAEIAALVGQYFELQKAAGKVAAAQDDLNDVTQKYADALRPINDQLDAVRDKQDEIRDNQRLQALGKELTDPTKTVDERQLARLEIQQIELEKQAGAITKERDVAVDASQAKIDAAKKEEAAQQAKLDVAQAALDQQVKTNSLITEEITLRTRLADEALADQKRALADLEEEQRKATAADEKRLAALEAIHQAQLGFNLASTDAAGQLALLQHELDGTVKGSADYFDILTRMLPLQKKLAEEAKKAAEDQAAAAAAAANLADKGVVAPEAIDPSITRATDALDALFKKLESTDTVKLNPFFQGIADAIKNISDASVLAKPIIQGFIDLFTGESADVPLADILRPTESGGGLFGGILGGMRNLLSALTLIKNGEWGTLWNGFKGAIAGFLSTIDPDADPSTFGFYSFLVNNLIPAIDALRVGDWRRAWTDLGGEAVEAFAAGIVNSKSGKIMQQLSIDLINKDGLAFIRDIGQLFGGGGESSTPATPEIPAPVLKDPESGALDWTEIWRQAIRDMLKGIQPGAGMLIPQSSIMPGGGLPQMPLLASSSVTNGGAQNVIFNIEQTIGSSGDFGGARSGALAGMDSIRQALLSRKMGTA